MKIWCQQPMSMPRNNPVFENYYRLLERDYGLVKRPETEFVIQDVPDGFTDTEMFSYLGLRFLNDRQILKRMIQAQEEGYDAVIGMCYFDSGIEAARQLLEIPVVGAAESAMFTACLMGHCFGTITEDSRWVPEMEKHIHDLRLEKRAVSEKPIRPLNFSSENFLDCLRGNFKPAIDDFSSVARDLIKDGADVIISGCGLLSPMVTLSETRMIDGVPIIDPLLTSLKIAELMVDFRRSGFPVKSLSGLFLGCDAGTIKTSYSLFKI